MTPIDKALVLRTQCTNIIDPKLLMLFTTGKVAILQNADLYKSPAIPAIPYTDLLSASGVVGDFVIIYNNAPTTENLHLMQGKMNLLKGLWDTEFDWVELISNDPVNASTTEQAVLNIESAGLKAHSLIKTDAGIPIQPVVKVMNTTSGEVKAKTTNADYAAAQTTFVIVETAANATVNVVDGQLTVVFPIITNTISSMPAPSSPSSTTVPSTFIVKSVKGKGGIYNVIKSLTSGKSYVILAFGTNSKGKSGPLSTPQMFFST